MYCKIYIRTIITTAPKYLWTLNRNKRITEKNKTKNTKKKYHVAGDVRLLPQSAIIIYVNQALYTDKSPKKNIKSNKWIEILL